MTILGGVVFCSFEINKNKTGERKVIEMICTLFGDFPNEKALRIEAINIAKETKFNLTKQALISAACEIEQLLMGKTLSVVPNLKQKIYGNHFSF